jgi:hypothetical protein
MKVVPEMAWATCGSAFGQSDAERLQSIAARLREVLEDTAPEPLPEPLAALLRRLDDLERRESNDGVSATPLEVCSVAAEFALVEKNP